MNNLVTLNKNNQPTTSSKVIADTFRKVHRDVVRAINNLDIPEDFRVRNFAQSKFKADNINGLEYDCYEITRDGFTLLAMGFTGKKAMEWKIKYIEAFNRMEATVRESRTVAAPAVNEDLKDWCAQALALMIENRVRMAVEDERDRIAEQLKLCLTRGNPK